MTRVVVGGRPVARDDCEILSREVLRLVIPPGIRMLISGGGQRSVEVFVATPNGVSNRLLIPASDDVVLPHPPGPHVTSPFSSRDSARVPRKPDESSHPPNPTSGGPVHARPLPEPNPASPGNRKQGK